MDALRTLAENTDGRAIVNRNDLGTAMKQIIRDASAYYLVGYTTQAPSDGKFHEIKVRVKRPGVQVRSRRGFWAYTADDLKRAVAGPKPGPPAAVTKALAAIAPLTNRRYIRTWIGNDKGDEGRTKVTLLWEPLPPTPGVKRDEPRRVTVLATSPSGDIVYRGRVPTELAVSGNWRHRQFQRATRQARCAPHHRRRRYGHARCRRSRSDGARSLRARDHPDHAEGVGGTHGARVHGAHLGHAARRRW